MTPFQMLPVSTARSVVTRTNWFGQLLGCTGKPSGQRKIQYFPSDFKIKTSLDVISRPLS